jgi:glutamine synthetase
MNSRNAARQAAIAGVAASRPLDKHIDYRREPLQEIYGSLVFDEPAMRERLPGDVFRQLSATIHEGRPLAPQIADVVANSMKDWAVENGATHYPHWFQPMTGNTAEKHDAFLAPSVSGRVINEFSGKMLIKGESDASSFPSGGIRSTFEARGYTAWDPRSPVFIKESLNGKTLCIPTAFCSYTGECLDRKTPLLRSTQALSHHALRILRLFGNNSAAYVNCSIGVEQEYFLVDRQLYLLRPDLVNTGRTLYGARPPKGQELGDHYFGAIRARVLAFMMDVEKRLYRLGVPLKTRHNEVAPAQFELAPIYEEANIATDHNMLIMETLRGVARDHGFICLLHEKPFKGVNGSGKHNNWSLADSDGNNLLDPGDTPRDNAQFLVFLCAVMRAIHKYAALIRIGTATAGNDHRLGAHEAPPAILSMFLGNELMDVVEGICQGTECKDREREYMRIGVTALPALPRDATDRNRTSPVAFTGNKFEFRAVGSSQSPAPTIFLVNTAVTEALDTYADTLEAAVAKGTPFLDAVHALLRDEFEAHAPVLFSGDSYSAAWPKEAEQRGLPNLKDSVSALERFADEENVALLSRYGVLSPREVGARRDILLDSYSGSLVIEAQVALDMGRTALLPAALDWQKKLADTVRALRESGFDTDTETHLTLIARVNRHVRDFMIALDRLDEELFRCQDIKGSALERAKFCRDLLVPVMAACRAEGDALEQLVDDSLWPLPKYRELLWVY